MKIAISGSTGFIGSALRKRFREKNYDIIRINRNDFSRPSQELAEKISGADAIIHLSGAPIIKRWTKKNKEIIYNSRVNTTSKLADAILIAEKKPAVFIAASAIGIFSKNGRHDEESRKYDEGFVGNLCRDWEAAAEPAGKEVRLAIFRIGVVLGKRGGVLKKLLPVYKLGLGGSLASGRQRMSWIHLEDLLRAYEWVLMHDNLRGVFNITAPQSVTNNTFSKTLAAKVKRPAFFRVPAIALKLLYGKGASAVLDSKDVYPGNLEKSGFHFLFPELKEALKEI